MIAIVRLYQDSYGENMGSRTFCQLSKFFNGILVTDNKKIQQLKEFKQITHAEAISNIKKFTKLIVYNTKPNMFGGVAPKHCAEVVRLILGINEIYFYNCDPILDLQNSVPSSHEKAVPGLTSAINKIIQRGVKLSRVNTHLTKFLASQLSEHIVTEKIEKEFTACYFGNARQPYRQEQVKELLSGLKSLIIGHEHEDFAWFNYTANFYNLLSMAWVTPIIGDKKLHYETGIPSLRLYEACCSTSIVLIDRRFTEDLGLPDDFYFADAVEFQKKSIQISTDLHKYEWMLQTQRKLLKKIIRQFKNKRFNWKTIAVKKKKENKQRIKHVKTLKKNEINLAKQRLIKKGLL